MAGAVRADEVTDWHEHMLVALGTAGVSPIVSSREAALVSAAVFDAVNGIERRYAPIHVPAAAPRGASKRAAAVQAAYVILLARFPAQAADLNVKRAASLAAIGDGRIRAARRGVGTDSRRCNSRLAKHRWIHTAAAALSRRTRTRPMASDPASVSAWRGAAIRHHDSLGDPVARPISSRWGLPRWTVNSISPDFNEVRQMGSATSALRTADETDACLFWRSASGNYVWNRAAIDLGADQGTDLSENAHLLATLNLAIADAAHCLLGREIRVTSSGDRLRPFAWRIPTETRRPSKIQHGRRSWRPRRFRSTRRAIRAPPARLPPYWPITSAMTPRSCLSRQRRVGFGSIRVFPRRSTRSPMARVFAGIHFRAACEDGATLGSEVAAFILENSMGRIHGEGE